MLRPSLLTAACCLVVASAQLTGVVLPQAVADLYGAKCLDGTPPSFAISKGASSSFIIFLEGGGWCADVTVEGTVSNCIGRAHGGGGSSNGYNGSNYNIGGLLSTNATENPRFYDWTMVFVHYCDGASFTSYAEAPIPVPPHLADSAGNLTEIWMRGRPNLIAVMGYLSQKFGLSTAKEVILSGGSAGATAAYINADFVKTLLPRTASFVVAPDAGFFLDEPNVAGEFWYRNTFIAADQVWNSSGSGNLNTNCLSANPSAAWRCFFPQYSVPHIATPLYISNSPVDMWGLTEILSIGCVPTADNASFGGMVGCNATQWGALQQWWDDFHAAIDPLLAANPRIGAFIPSCYVHEINVDYCSGQTLPNCRGWAKYSVKPSVGGAALLENQAFPLWYDATVGTAARYGKYQLVDTIRYPTNPSCPFPPPAATLPA